MPARRVLQRDAEWWNKLRNDCSVRFGYMPQNELSGKKLEISDNTLYQFGNGRFISHQLMDEGRPICQMIVANAGNNQVYLALSRRLGERDIVNLFADDERQALPDLSAFSKLYVREHSPGVKDWVTMQYHRRLDGMRGQKTTAQGTRTFQYALFVNDTNDKALEIEWFDDGGYEVYATLYRPLSDIVQVQHERRAPKTSTEPESREGPRLPELEPAPSAEIIALPLARKESQVAEEDTYEPEEEFAADFPEETLEYEPSSLAIIEPEPEPQPVAQEMALPVGHAVPDGNLTCNIRVAAKIIDEALRNDMHLGDIVRRVLGLPVAISETVNFHVPLTELDYQNLAERYGLSPQDRAMIHEYIVQDLIDFTGEREADTRRRRYGQG